jgi:hypothetical protein
MIGVEFETPYIHEIPFDDEPPDQNCDDTADNTYRLFAFDTPEALLAYAFRRDNTIEPGRISWQLDYALEKFLVNCSVAALNLALTAKGNLKKSDQEHLDRCISRLHANIETDLELWLENDPCYQKLIRDRVNEAIKGLLEPRSERPREHSSYPEATQETSAA